MANNPQFKVIQLAKDLGLKSKDVVDLCADMGMDIKTQKTLEPGEFDLLFDALTKSRQVDNIDDYLDGVTYIPSRLPKKESAEEAAALAAQKAAAEKAAADKVAAEKAAADKAAAEKAAADKAAAEKAAADKAAADALAAQKAAADKAAADKAAAEKAAADQLAAQKAAARAAAFERAAAIEAAARAAADKRALGRTAQGQGQKPAQGQGQRPAPAQGQGQRPAPGQGQGQRPSQGQGQGQRPAPVQGQGQRPAQSQGQDRFARDGQDRRQVPGQGQRPAQGQGQDRGFGDRGRDNGRPGSQRPNNGGYGQRGGMDKDDYVPSAPKEKFQVQPIVRSQTPKGGDGQPKKKGAVRVVDTRTTEVDLSKYDERLDTFVTETERDLRDGSRGGKKQQIGKQAAKNQKGGKKQQPVVKQVVRLEIPEEISVGELASRLKASVGEVIKKLVGLGVMATVNQLIDFDTAAMVCEEMGAEYTREVVVTIEEKLFDQTEDTDEVLQGRAPVVCVMGHVDHGKTSILDAIRHANVTAGEAGGITQHIGAYRVKINDQDITFLDTPGHEAFTAMRARGAQATDIAILVVAADDGIMPQTVEAINHAKAAGIDIIVAINKMDKPTANPDAVKQELTKYDLVPEEWGGDVICVPVSALTKMGIDDLLESVLLVAEVKELKANPDRRAKGIIIESRLDRGRGPVATVLVQNGTLRAGDVVIAGTAVGRVRAMTDHTGRSVKVAGPSVPVEITGLAEVPQAGDQFAAVEDEKMARELAEQRKAQAKEEVFKANSRANLNDLFAQISEGVKDLNIIIKADVDGSAEAVKQSLQKLTNEEVKVNIIHAAVGGITEGDVMLAAASNAIIVGFNVRPDKSALDSAERQSVDIRTYRIIYDCIEEISAAMKGMLAPQFVEVLLGHAQVRQTIHVPNVGFIAGSYVQDGKITRQAQIRVVRDGIVIFEDEIASLRRFKDDVREVAAGYECGIGLKKFNDIRTNDILEAFIMQEVER